MLASGGVVRLADPWDADTPGMKLKMYRPYLFHDRESQSAQTFEGEERCPVVLSYSF